MDHSYIDEHQVAERYALGRLSPEDAAAFEEHSLSCPQCLDRLEAADELRLGLRHLAAEKATEEAAGAVVHLGLLARLARSRTAPWALAALFLAALLPSGLLLREVGERDRALAEARVALARSPRESPPTPDRTAEIAALRTAAAESTRQAETERRERERLAAELAESRGPRVNVPIVPLAPERSGPTGSTAEPTTRVALPPTAGWIVLALELEATGARHRATLRGPAGTTLWQSADLRPDAAGTLTVALPAALFAPGVFRVEVEELPAQGEPIAAGEFAFRVVPGR